MKITIGGFPPPEVVKSLDVPELGVIPGVGVEVYNVEGIAELYPWHRVILIERETPKPSPLVVPVPQIADI